MNINDDINRKIPKEEFIKNIDRWIRDVENGPIYFAVGVIDCGGDYIPATFKYEENQQSDTFSIQVSIDDNYD